MANQNLAYLQMTEWLYQRHEPDTPLESSLTLSEHSSSKRIKAANKKQVSLNLGQNSSVIGLVKQTELSNSIDSEIKKISKPSASVLPRIKLQNPAYTDKRKYSFQPTLCSTHYP